MKKLEGFDQQNLSKIRKDLNEALETVGEKYGILFDIGNVNYGDKSFRTKLKCVIVTNENVNSLLEVEWENEWNEKALYFGQEFEKYLGSVFTYDNKNYKILGMKPRARKYNIVVKDVICGKIVLFKFDTVITCLCK